MKQARLFMAFPSVFYLNYGFSNRNNFGILFSFEILQEEVERLCNKTCQKKKIVEWVLPLMITKKGNK